MSREPKQPDHLARLGPLLFIIVAMAILQFFHWFVTA